MPADLSTLRHPMVLLAFKGWNDAGEAASGAVSHLTQLKPVEPLWTLDSQQYYDFTEQRPMVVHGDKGRDLVWPTTTVSVVALEERDLVVIEGHEPNLRWQDFCEELLEKVGPADPELVIALGCMVTDDPHSRPLPVHSSSPSAEVRRELAVRQEKYEGPTGITGVLSTAFAKAGFRTVSFWGTAPHYNTRQDCPKSTLALLRRVSDAIGESIPEGDLPQQALEWEAEVSTAIAGSDEMVSYVADLESTYDEGIRETTGDDIAAEFQRYLRREQRSD